jgi:hypothetical protein
MNRFPSWLHFRLTNGGTRVNLYAPIIYFRSQGLAPTQAGHGRRACAVAHALLHLAS